MTRVTRVFDANGKEEEMDVFQALQDVGQGKLLIINFPIFAMHHTQFKLN